jgi:FkbM family methyltransferase
MTRAAMVVNTRRLFARLLRPLRISDICDIGSMDGEDAVAFSLAAPQARVYAFEPNPGNYRLMALNPALQQRNIQVVPLAVTTHDGEAEFFLVEAEYSGRDPRRGMSSLHRRSGEWAPAAVVRVETTRLDTFLADRCGTGARLALWIDTEGSAYEVVEGLGGLAGQVHLLHVEVETSPCIGSRQRLYPEVKSLLHRLGFAELATDQPACNVQFNALFVRLDLSARLRLRVRAWLLGAALRRLVGTRVARWCPACLRRYQALRGRGGS